VLSQAGWYGSTTSVRICSGSVVGSLR
jgi:ABC-type lipoprotein export system ATPase subunit